jgi:hypothetical protein
MANDAPSSAPPAAPLSPVAAVAGTFSAPSETFRRLVAAPTWWLPFVLTTLTVLLIVGVSGRKIDIDKTVREQIEKREQKTGQTVPPAMVERQIEFSKKFTNVFLGVAVLFSVAAFFVVALVLWGASRVMGGETRYGQLLAIWAHAGLPSVVGGLLAVPIFLGVPDASLTQTQAQQVVKSNVGAFLPESAPAFARAAASSLDIFAIACLILLVLGFRQLPGLSKGAATATPFVLWLIMILVKVAFASFFG